MMNAGLRPHMTRRSGLLHAPALIFLPALYPSNVRPALGQTALDAKTAAIGAWMMGGQLGLAALVYFRNTGRYEQFFDEAKVRAKELGIDVKDFPPRPADSVMGLAELAKYLNNGDGKRINSDLRRKYGSYHATLYDVSSRCMMCHLACF